MVVGLCGDVLGWNGSHSFHSFPFSSSASVFFVGHLLEWVLFGSSQRPA